jgi:hypothetical protein
MGPLSKISKVSQSNNNSEEKVADDKKVKVEEVKYWVRVNQRICFPPNVFRFPLPARLQCVEPAGGGMSRKRKTFGVKCIR